jgi:hypothetical protein
MKILNITALNILNEREREKEGHFCYLHKPAITTNGVG